MIERSNGNDFEYGARRNPHGYDDHAGDPLLNHLVSRGQQRFRDGEAEGFGRLEIDY